MREQIAIQNEIAAIQAIVIRLSIVATVQRPPKAPPQAWAVVKHTVKRILQ